MIGHLVFRELRHVYRPHLQNVALYFLLYNKFCTILSYLENLQLLILEEILSVIY